MLASKAALQTAEAEKSALIEEARQQLEAAMKRAALDQEKAVAAAVLAAMQSFKAPSSQFSLKMSW